MARHDYDEDVFTLKEDEAGKRRSHTIQYTLLSVFAVVVIAGAFFAGFKLTQSRIEYQTLAEQEEQELPNPNALDLATADWPKAEFPNVPVLSANEYKTTSDDGRAEINIPMAATAGFESYTEQLADGGAHIYVQTPRLTVLNYRGIEIHLISGSGKNAVVLCNEPRIDWNDPAYSAFPILKKGNLIKQMEGTGEGSRVLTYRLVSAHDMIEYISTLTSNGWTIVGSLDPQDYVFNCSFTKDDMKITIDYFSSNKDDCIVKFDFVSRDPEGQAS